MEGSLVISKRKFYCRYFDVTHMWILRIGQALRTSHRHVPSRHDEILGPKFVQFAGTQILPHMPLMFGQFKVSKVHVFIIAFLRLEASWSLCERKDEKLTIVDRRASQAQLTYIFGYEFNNFVFYFLWIPCCRKCTNCVANLNSVETISEMQSK